MWTFEPHVASQVYREMLAEAGITPIMNERLDRERGVKKDGPRIVSITTESGRTFTGRMFIDATYEGDLMAAAGVAYHVGREATTFTAKRSTACSRSSTSRIIASRSRSIRT